jgi:sporulation protein YlmC with PRC-barrel domain
MPTTFSLEILRREVVDVAGEFLGTLADFSVDITTGNVVAILVALEPDSYAVANNRGITFNTC